jgi:hypothetical protein
MSMWQWPGGHPHARVWSQGPPSFASSEALEDDGELSVVRGSRGGHASRLSGTRPEAAQYCVGGTIASLPAALFDLPGLTGVLNLNTWVRLLEHVWCSALFIFSVGNWCRISHVLGLPIYQATLSVIPFLFFLHLCFPFALPWRAGTQFSMRNRGAHAPHASRQMAQLLAFSLMV